MLKCSFFEIDITPTIGASIPGYFTDRISTSIKDNLYAHAFAASDGLKTVIIISLDAIGIYSYDVDIIRKKISAATNVAPSDIFVAATHAHTAGPVIDLYQTSRDPEYMEFLDSKAADAGIAAFRNMVPAKIGYDVVGVRNVGFTRRWYMADGTVKMNPPIGSPDMIAPADITDPDLVVVRIDHEDGSPMGMITNFAMHPDGVGGTAFSADYPGVMRKIIKSHYGYDMGFMFLNGCCGNINFTDRARTVPPINTSKKGYFDKAKILSSAAIKLFDKINVSDDVKIKSTTDHIIADIRVPTEEEIEKNAPHLQREMHIAVEMGGGQHECEIQCIAIGDMAITGMPGEVFCVFGMLTKIGSPYKINIISELANDSTGYIYTREARQLGGYEATPSSYIRLDEETGYKFVNAAIKNLRNMK